ncbi:hypothetical protein EDD22DRAFT_866563 [Suillus occidentalis]|nr:hypothetical protein EDD22DRAFT_866563 [Suillus occidentalis]
MFTNQTIYSLLLIKVAIALFDTSKQYLLVIHELATVCTGNADFLSFVSWKYLGWRAHDEAAHHFPVNSDAPSLKFILEIYEDSIVVH